MRTNSSEEGEQGNKWKQKKAGGKGDKEGRKDEARKRDINTSYLHVYSGSFQRG